MLLSLCGKGEEHYADPSATRSSRTHSTGRSTPPSLSAAAAITSLAFIVIQQGEADVIERRRRTGVHRVLGRSDEDRLDPVKDGPPTLALDGNLGLAEAAVQEGHGRLDAALLRSAVNRDLVQRPDRVRGEAAGEIHDLRDVIDTITSKAILILGRFTEERKKVLDALREELRKRDYLPILFDFEKPRSRNTDETITLLARMARFIIADISDAKSVLQELRGIVPDLSSVPVQPVILTTQEELGMFDFFRSRPWVLETYRYNSQEQLIADLGERVIRPAEDKVSELRKQVP
jgi:hypothetical protein